MATSSSAGGGSSMSNAGVGTRALSAGDWTRMQRLRGAKAYGVVSGGMPDRGDNNITATQFAKNSDIYTTPGNQQRYGPALLIPRDVGTSKIRRTASSWTDFIAAGDGDFVTNAQTTGGSPGITQTITKIGSGATDSTIIPNKSHLPGANAFNRLKILS